MPTFSSGYNFTDAYQFRPYLYGANILRVFDSSGSAQTSQTTAFFTEMARRGLQDQTDWTANTPKTLLNVASGPVEVVFMCGPQAGGAETTTFEITGDKGVQEVTVGTLASGERAALVAPGSVMPAEYYTAANVQLLPYNETLESDKATLADPSGNFQNVAPWFAISQPLFVSSNGILIRAKHSANITNSTATAYSAIMYRKRLTA